MSTYRLIDAGFWFAGRTLTGVPLTAMSPFNVVPDICVVLSFIALLLLFRGYNLSVVANDHVRIARPAFLV